MAEARERQLSWQHPMTVGELSRCLNPFIAESPTGTGGGGGREGDGMIPCDHGRLGNWELE